MTRAEFAIVAAIMMRSAGDEAVRDDVCSFTSCRISVLYSIIACGVSVLLAY